MNVYLREMSQIFRLVLLFRVCLLDVMLKPAAKQQVTFVIFIHAIVITSSGRVPVTVDVNIATIAVFEERSFSTIEMSLFLLTQLKL